MPAFRCSKCGCVENTACSNYWHHVAPMDDEEKQEPLCSQCDPEIGKWHGEFPKLPADGFQIGEDGFIYGPSEKPTHTKIVGMVPGECQWPDPEEPEWPEDMEEGD